jgi:hypothetical protein
LIAALLLALVCYLGATVYCVYTLVVHRHLHPLGWIVLASDLSLLWLGYGYVRYVNWLANDEERTDSADDYRREMPFAGRILLFPRRSTSRRTARNLPNVGGTRAAAASDNLRSGRKPFRGE